MAHRGMLLPGEGTDLKRSAGPRTAPTSTSELTPVQAAGFPARTPGTAQPITKVLRLVTAHEENYHTQGIAIADLMRRVSDLETKQSADQELLKAIKDKHFILDGFQKMSHQIDVMGASLEELSGKVADVQSWRPHLGRLQCEVNRMEEQLLEIGRIQQLNTVSLEQQQVQQQQQQQQQKQQQQLSNTASLEQQVGALKAMMWEQDTAERQLKEAVEVLKSEASVMQADTAMCRAKVEAVGTQCKNLESQVRGLSQGLAAAEQLATSRMEGVAVFVKRVAAQVDELGLSDKKIKKHVIKMQRTQENLQSASQECKQELKDLLVAVNGAKSESLEAKTHSSEAKSQSVEAKSQSLEAMEVAQVTRSRLQDISSRLREISSRLDVVNVGQSTQVQELQREMVVMAESVGSCMAQLSDCSKRNSAPASYLHSLLGPATLPVQPMGTRWGNAAQRHEDEWDMAIGEYERFLQSFRARTILNATKYQLPEQQQHSTDLSRDQYSASRDHKRQGGTVK